MELIETYPTLETVKTASRYQICKWHRHLRCACTDKEIEISNAIYDRFTELGGFTPELSKQIGW